MDCAINVHMVAPFSRRVESSRREWPLSPEEGYRSRVGVTSTSLVVGDWPPEGLDRVASCPACGETGRSVLYADLTDRSYRSAPGRWTLVRCERCSCAYLDPRPSRDTAPLAYRTYYEGSVEPRKEAPQSGWRRLRRGLRNGYLNSTYGYRASPAVGIGRLVVRLLPRYRELADMHVRHLRFPGPGAAVLDVGCGEGEFLAELQALGWCARGIDPSDAAVAVAQARGVHATPGTFANTSLEAGSLDAITFRLVFEHIGDPVEALAKCRGALRPRGTLWIATPSLDSRAHRAFGRHWIHLEPPRHAVLYTTRSLTRLLAAGGFDVVSVEPLRQARWSFRLSAALANGLSPFEHAPQLSLRAAAGALLADLEALYRPEKADVVVVIARVR
jgi:2-polyprenyl-3-methyl-5-hydroxy-6-metoxy-1,4-benzoquinol methylase